MYYNFKVEIPQAKSKIVRNKIKGVEYISYEYSRQYLPEKKYNVPKRTTIGKVCGEDNQMMYPNLNFLKFFPGVEVPELSGSVNRSSCLKTGAFIVIQKIIQDYKLDEMMRDIIGQDSGLFLDLACYSIITEGNVAQYYPDYAYNHPLLTNNMRIYSDAKISEFLTQISQSQSIAFLNQWNSSRKHSERIYISYDSTNKACQAGDIEMVEYGRPKDGSSNTIFNFSIAYDIKNKEPLFYEEYPGSIVDVSQLQYMLEKARGYGYSKAGFILDRGYFSKDNIHYMDKCGYDFVIMVKGMKKLVSELVLANKGTFEENRSYSIREYGINGITISQQLYPSDNKPRYSHVFYSTSKHALEREALEVRIDKMASYLRQQHGKTVIIDESFKTYFDLIYHHLNQADQHFMYGRELHDVIDNEIALCGYFVIITSQKMSAKEALLLYKSRDASEKLFRGDKSYLGNGSLRVHSDESASTKIFIEFVALIIRNKIYTLLKDEMVRNDKKANYMSVPAAIRELEKIELVKILDSNYRLDHAITATQKAILKAFDIDATFIKDRNNIISNKLAYHD